MSNKKQLPQTLKGFRDFLPADALKRSWLKEKITQVFESWGYDPIETPTLEPLELFKGQIGEEENLFFQFKDAGDRDVALRYDQTVPTCRLVAQNYQNLPMPFKRYQIQSAFRSEKPQKGRYREFTQCDADIFGVESPLADAEVIALGLDIYRQLGFKEAKVLVNDRSLMNNLPYEAIVAIDKLKKIGEDGVIKEMVKKGIDQDQAQQYLDQVKQTKPNQAIETIFNYLKELGFPSDWYEFDPTIARSFSYSSGPIWEIIIPGFDAGSVLGGERFDNLVERISGVSIPATGFGLGFDRTLEAAEQMGLVPTMQTSTQVLISVIGSQNLKYALDVSAKLRKLDVNTEIYTDIDQKTGKQFKYANKKGIETVVVIGDLERENQSVSVKDMSSGDQKELKISELASLKLVD